MHVKIRKRIGNPTLYNAKINYSRKATLRTYEKDGEGDIYRVLE